MGIEEVRQIQERAEKASEGPWIQSNPESQWVIPEAHKDRKIGWSSNPKADAEEYAHQICKVLERKGRSEEELMGNAAFIAESRENVPRLCESWLEQSATIVLLRVALEKKAYSLYASMHGPTVQCDVCGAWVYGEDKASINHKSDCLLSSLPEQAGNFVRDTERLDHMDAHCRGANELQFQLLGDCNGLREAIDAAMQTDGTALGDAEGEANA